MRTTDFRSDPETARKAVNSWVADATNDHIDQLAPRGTISPTTRILAAGAAYLKAPWVTPFADTETRLAPFRHLDGSVSTVSMMRNPDLTDARYGTGDGWVAVDLPYLGRSLWLTVIVPDDGRFTDVERGLDGDGLRELLRSLAPTTLDLSLPKFGFTTDTPLTDALRSLGLTIATDPFAADFSGISTEPLSLTSVLHQTYLAIAEQGTEATATNPKPPATTPTTRATTTTTAPTTTASAGEGQLEGVDPTTTSTVPDDDRPDGAEGHGGHRRPAVPGAGARPPHGGGAVLRPGALAQRLNARRQVHDRPVGRPQGEQVPAARPARGPRPAARRRRPPIARRRRGTRPRPGTARSRHRPRGRGRGRRRRGGGPGAARRPPTPWRCWRGRARRGRWRAAATGRW